MKLPPRPKNPNFLPFTDWLPSSVLYSSVPMLTDVHKSEILCR